MNGASDLADGFTGTALFSAELVEFSLQLVADGVDQGIIADATSPALTATGTSYSLALAEIAGLGDMLGDQNLFLAEATFDLDGDPQTNGPGEGLVTVRTAGVLGLAPEPVTLTGTARADLLFGSAGDDTIDGGDGNDLILAGPGNDHVFGGAGDDVLIGGPGIDSLFGGAGDDELVAGGELMPGEVYDGGVGRDVLAFLMPETADADLLPSLTLTGIEVFDLENGQFDVLRLSLADVLEVTGGLDPATSDTGSLTIFGDFNDELVLDPEDGDISLTGTENDGDQAFDIYAVTDSSGELLATLAVDTDIVVSGAAGV